MQMFTPFVNVIGSYDASKILPNLRKIYDHNADKFLNLPNTGGTKQVPSLENYGMCNAITCLDSSDNAATIKKLIYDAAKEYAISCGFTNKRLTPNIVNFWLNELLSGGNHKSHSHYSAHFSGCIYVDMPIGCSGIYFVSPMERYDWRPMESEVTPNACNSQVWEYLPSEGQMLIWQSWMKHGVNQSEFEGVRRAVAFDVVMTIDN